MVKHDGEVKIVLIGSLLFIFFAFFYLFGPGIDTVHSEMYNNCWKRKKKRKNHSKHSGKAFHNLNSIYQCLNHSLDITNNKIFQVHSIGHVLNHVLSQTAIPTSY